MSLKKPEGWDPAAATPSWAPCRCSCLKHDSDNNLKDGIRNKCPQEVGWYLTGYFVKLKRTEHCLILIGSSIVQYFPSFPYGISLEDFFHTVQFPPLLWIRDILVRIRNLLFSSVADIMPTKNKCPQEVGWYLTGYFVKLKRTEHCLILIGISIVQYFPNFPYGRISLKDFFPTVQFPHCCGSVTFWYGSGTCFLRQ